MSFPLDRFLTDERDFPAVCSVSVVGDITARKPSCPEYLAIHPKFPEPRRPFHHTGGGRSMMKGGQSGRLHGRNRCLRGEAASESFCKLRMGRWSPCRHPGTMQSMVAHGARVGQSQPARPLAPYPRASPDSWQNRTRRRPRRTLTGMTKARLGPQGSCGLRKYLPATCCSAVLSGQSEAGTTSQSSCSVSTASISLTPRVVTIAPLSSFWRPCVGQAQ